MKTIVTSKLMRKCLILAVLIMGLVFVASSDRYAEPVAAAPCCEGCPGDGDPAQADVNCGTSCAFIFGPGGPLWQQCYDDCMEPAYDCYNRCVYCSSGSGPGQQCSFTSDCPIGCFCGADNNCHC